MELSDVRGPTLTAKGRATRQRIIEVASDLMVVRGVGEVSLDEVGRATTTSKSQMYHYFANKDELVSAVVGHVRDQILEYHAGALATVSTIDDLQRWEHDIVELQRRSAQWCGCPLGTLASELIAESGTERLDIRESFRSWESLFQMTFRRLRDNGELRASADVDRLAMATLTSLQGGLLLSKALRSATPLETALDAAVDLVRTFSNS